jgi:hypothetical protein
MIRHDGGGEENGNVKLICGRKQCENGKSKRSSGMLFEGSLAVASAL